MRKFVYMTLLAAAGLAPSIAYAQDRDAEGRPQWRAQMHVDRENDAGQARIAPPQRNDAPQAEFRQRPQFTPQMPPQSAPQSQPQFQAPQPRFQPPAQGQAPNFQGNGGGWRGNRGGFNGQPQGVPQVTPTPPVPGQRDFDRNRGGNFGGNFQDNRPAPNIRGDGRPAAGDWNRGGDRADPRRFDGRRDDRGFDGRRDGWQGYNGWRGNNGWQGNNANRGYDNNRRWDRDGDRRWDHDGGRRWDNNWRRDNRYDWRDYRSHNRDAFRLPRYYAPYGWGYGYQRFGIGFRLNSLLFSQSYWIDDPEYYRLPSAYGQYRWVRYYNDALLVDIYTGEVVDVEYGIFW